VYTHCLHRRDPNTGFRKDLLQLFLVVNDVYFAQSIENKNSLQNSVENRRRIVLLNTTNERYVEKICINVCSLQYTFCERKLMLLKKDARNK
jgi:hypothetical protein